MNVLVEIGNTDNGLTQQEWGNFCEDVITAIVIRSEQIYSSLYSLSPAKWQNAGFHFKVTELEAMKLQTELLAIKSKYHQQSIAWSRTETTFLGEEVGIMPVIDVEEKAEHKPTQMADNILKEIQRLAPGIPLDEPPITRNGDYVTIDLPGCTSISRLMALNYARKILELCQETEG